MTCDLVTGITLLDMQFTSSWVNLLLQFSVLPAIVMLYILHQSDTILDGIPPNEKLLQVLFEVNYTNKCSWLFTDINERHYAYNIVVKTLSTPDSLVPRGLNFQWRPLVRTKMSRNGSLSLTF